MKSPSWMAPGRNTVTLVQVFEKEGPGVKITKPDLQQSGIQSLFVQVLLRRRVRALRSPSRTCAFRNTVTLCAGVTEKEGPGVKIAKLDCTSQEYSHSFCRCLRRRVRALGSPSWTAPVRNTVTLVQVFEKEGPGVKITKPDLHQSGIQSLLCRSLRRRVRA